MSIEINQSVNSQLLRSDHKSQAQLNENKPASDRIPNQPKNSASEDTVMITDQAQSLNKLHKSIENHPVVDAQKVEHIQKMLARGDYKIDSQSIAKRLLDEQG